MFGGLSCSLTRRCDPVSQSYRGVLVLVPFAVCPNVLVLHMQLHKVLKVLLLLPQIFQSYWGKHFSFTSTDCSGSGPVLISLEVLWFFLKPFSLEPKSNKPPRRFWFWSQNDELRNRVPAGERLRDVMMSKTPEPEPVWVQYLAAVYTTTFSANASFQKRLPEWRHLKTRWFVVMET